LRAGKEKNAISSGGSQHCFKWRPGSKFLGLFVKRLTGTLQPFFSAKIILKRYTKDANCFKLSACTIYIINTKHIAAFPKETGKFSLKGASIAEYVCFGAKIMANPHFAYLLSFQKEL